MRSMLMLVIVVIGASDILGIDIGLAPGLSVKNALLYVGIGLLLMQRAVTGRPHLQMVWMQAAFLLLVVYAIGSLVLNIVILQLPGYRPVNQLITLKTQLIDRFVLFVLFFYAARSHTDVQRVLTCLLVVIALGSVFTITNVAGLTSIGNTTYGADNEVEGGRIFGYFGHANETGTLLALLLPAYMAMSDRSRGMARAAWIFAVAATALMLVMTGSRSALLGLVIGAGGVAFAYRRLFPRAGVRRWLLRAITVLVPAMLVMGWQYVQGLAERVALQASGPVADASSGRTELWTDALEAMLSSPWTLLSGFGWGGWDAHNFRYVAHNNYLSYWFDLGLPGLVLLLVLLIGACLAARRALQHAQPGDRGQLIAFIAGMAALLISMAFQTLFSPWPYIWAYIALMMRLALLQTGPVEATRPAPVVGPRVITAAPVTALRRS
jgi:O-antigen ligase